MGVAWGDEVEAGHITELIGIVERWQPNPSGLAGPFDGTALTGAETFWLAAYALAGRGGDLAAAAQRLRAAQADSLLRVSLDLSPLNLRGAVLSAAQLQNAVLGKACMEGAILGIARLDGAFLGGAQLQGAFLDRAMLTSAFLNGADLSRTSLYAAHLEKASLKGTSLEDAILERAVLDGADMSGAHMARADLSRASLVSAALNQADLSDATLYEAHLEQAYFTRACLLRTDLRRASFDANSRLNDALLNLAAMYQVSFDRTNLSVVTWSDVRHLGDELIAVDPRATTTAYTSSGQRVETPGKWKQAHTRAQEYTDAARAYRSLTVDLREQGVVKDATRFHFRAEVMSRRASLHRAVRRLRSPWVVIAPLLFLPWLLSLLLSVVAGYGVYHVWRLAITYVVVVVAFAGAYFLVGHQAHTGLSAVDAMVLSLTLFHGRGLQPASSLTDTMRAIASVEAILGLLVEGLFIAAFTRRITGS